MSAKKPTKRPWRGQWCRMAAWDEPKRSARRARSSAGSRSGPTTGGSPVWAGGSASASARAGSEPALPRSASGARRLATLLAAAPLGRGLPSAPPRRRSARLARARAARGRLPRGRLTPRGRAFRRRLACGALTCRRLARTGPAGRSPLLRLRRGLRGHPHPGGLRRCARPLLPRRHRRLVLHYCEPPPRESVGAQPSRACTMGIPRSSRGRKSAVDRASLATREGAGTKRPGLTRRGRRRERAVHL